LAISGGQWLATCPSCYNADTPELEAGWTAIGYLDKRKTPCPWWNTSPDHSTGSLVKSEDMFPPSETCRLVLQPNQLGLFLQQKAAEA